MIKTLARILEVFLRAFTAWEGWQRRRRIEQYKAKLRQLEERNAKALAENDSDALALCLRERIRLLDEIDREARLPPWLVRAGESESR